MTSHRPTVLGTQLSPGSRTELLHSMKQHLADGEGLLHVVTANPEYVMTARTEDAFAEAVNSAGVITIDGSGLAVAMRLLHPNVPIERYTGVQLTWDMTEVSAESGAGVFLLGAGPSVADDAARRLLEQHSAAKVVGRWAGGSPRPDDDAESIRRVAESSAKILLVAYGAPAQIYWIQRNFRDLQAAGVRIVTGIGGALDYISGHTPYAPALVRRLGMEWLYRLVREPWRWRRQLVLPHFAALVVWTFARNRLRRRVE